MSTTNLATIGRVSNAKMLEIYGVNGRKVVSESIGELKRAWQKPLCW